ncbi:MAG: 3-deoxy-D-manno-octulosonate 8-phosphate phosphatase [Bacteroidia bacterium]|jgi:3-deoxy-D-manno-octulosonate 8-phosphate phosphatase (KDO 8-P phosphatase)|nr:3-deoxy-D-manno-octulosonate 8-phosphate phosphatase [Bacteroidia bacterium]
MADNFKQLLNHIRAFAFDIDGVLTDGTVAIGSDNTVTRSFNTKDAHAITTAAKAGYTMAIISSAREESLRERLGGLGFEYIYLGCIDKEITLKEFAAETDLHYNQILYMGDDIPDLLPMRLSGVAACPHDAVHEIRSQSIYISPYKGGQGCVRDIIEQVLRLQNRWP